MNLRKLINVLLLALVLKNILRYSRFKKINRELIDYILNDLNVCRLSIKKIFLPINLS